MTFSLLIGEKMSENRKAREFWINVFPVEHIDHCHIYGWTTESLAKNAGKDDGPDPETIHVREVLPDETSAFHHETMRQVAEAKLHVVEQELERLRKEHAMMKEALVFYGAETTWSPSHFLCGSEVMRSDLSETKWSRFTPGKRARECLAKLEEK